MFIHLNISRTATDQRQEAMTKSFQWLEAADGPESDLSVSLVPIPHHPPSLPSFWRSPIALLCEKTCFQNLIVVSSQSCTSPYLSNWPRKDKARDYKHKRGRNCSRTVISWSQCKQQIWTTIWKTMLNNMRGNGILLLPGLLEFLVYLKYCFYYQIWHKF